MTQTPPARPPLWLVTLPVLSFMRLPGVVELIERKDAADRSRPVATMRKRWSGEWIAMESTVTGYSSALVYAKRASAD